MMNERKNYRRVSIAVILLSIMAALTSASASMSITASVSADSAMVGDELSLDVVITGVPKGAKIIPPETDKGFGEFAVLGWEDVSTQNTNKKAKGKDRDSSRYQYKYRVAAYKPRNCTIPSIRFLVNTGINNNGVNNNINNNNVDDDSQKFKRIAGQARNDGGFDDNNVSNDTAAGFSVNPINTAVGVNTDRYDTLSTPPIPIRMLSALPPSPPDSGGFALRDLKAQQGAGGADLRYLWAVLAVALAVVAFILIRKRLKKKGGAAGAPAVCLLPPYEEAIGAIEALEGKKYLERGLAREYVFELSEIFKRYIGRRYDTIAPELTTEEIAAWLEFSGISREMRLCAERFFRSSDQVKFAKRVPDRPCVDGYMRDVMMFIEATKPDPTLPYERKTERMGVVQ